MVRNDFMKFHKTYPMNALFEEWKWMEKEKELLISYLPDEYQKLQRQVEARCDRMEYEGSRMYDEHPDQEAIRHIIKLLCRDGGYEEDVAACFFWNEIFRRRYLHYLRNKVV